MSESRCGTCGWVWERDGEPVPDADNREALEHRLVGMVAEMWAAMPPEERAELEAALRIWAETGEVTGSLLVRPWR